MYHSVICSCTMPPMEEETPEEDNVELVFLVFYIEERGGAKGVIGLIFGFRCLLVDEEWFEEEEPRKLPSGTFFIKVLIVKNFK